MKLGELDCDTAFNTLVDLLKQLSLIDYRIFNEIIFNDFLRKYISKILFIICILFDYETIRGYEKYIIKYFINIYALQYFVRNLFIDNGMKFSLTVFIKNYNFKNYQQYLKMNNNKEIIIKYLSKNIMLTNLLIKSNNQNNIINDDISFNLDSILEELNLSNFDFFSNKLHSFKEDNSNNNTISLFFDQFFPKTKINDFFTENNLNSIKKDILNYYNQNNKYIEPHLLCSCLPIEYNFIKLPFSALDFQYIFFNVPCCYCKKIGYSSFICLTCGKKVCNSKYIKCKDLFPIFKHNEECGGGRSIFINTYNYKVNLIDNINNIYESDISLYTNKFGENPDNRTTSKTIKLNQEEIKKSLDKFINFSWTNHIRKI